MTYSVGVPLLHELISTTANWQEVLAAKHINISRDSLTDTRLVSLKYDQIDSPKDDPLTQECRGVVVDIKRNKIMSFGYKRFANYGESWAAEIDWRTARAPEKVDGSLIHLWYDDLTEAWTVSSSGNPMAAGTVWPGEQTFADLFWETFNGLNMELPDTSGKFHHPGSACFMFELCTTSNRIVVRHDKPRIVFHGARHLPHDKTSKALHWMEWSRPAMEGWADIHNWEIVDESPISSIEECLAAAAAMSGVTCEGFVIVDDNFNRIKVKSPEYLALHRLKDNVNSDKNLVTLILTGERDEIVAYFPELAKEFDRVEALMNAQLTKLEAVYAEFRHLEVQKDFALAIKDRVDMTGILFQARKNKVEVRDIWLKSADQIIKHVI